MKFISMKLNREPIKFYTHAYAIPSLSVCFHFPFLCFCFLTSSSLRRISLGENGFVTCQVQSIPKHRDRKCECMCVCVCMHTCMCVCVSAHTHNFLPTSISYTSKVPLLSVGDPLRSMPKNFSVPLKQVPGPQIGSEHLRSHW